MTSSDPPKAPALVPMPSAQDTSRFEAIFAYAAMGISLVDAQGRVMQANPALEAMLGYSADELSGMRFTEFTAPEDREQDWTLFQELMHGEREHYRIEKRCIRKDGDVVWGRLTVSQIQSASGDPVYTIAMLEDITERKDTELRLRETIDALRRVDRDRQRLLERLVRAQEDERRLIAADLHDETIQPMTAVQIRLAALARDAGTQDQAERLGIAEAMVSETIAGLRRTLTEVRPPALDHPRGLRTALRESLRRLELDTRIEAELVEDVAGEISPEVRAICYRITQEALMNVRKHGGAGSVRVTVVTRDGGVLVKILDDGAGFEHADGVEAREEGHLGLVSMRERAELAGGWCRIMSTPGRGTLVEFHVPDPTAPDRVPIEP